MLVLSPHRVELALVYPQIAPNAGNVARLCVATGTRLHLVRPLGFVLNDKRFRRSVMDYWPRLSLEVHDDLPGFRAAMTGRRLWLVDTTGRCGLWDAGFSDGDVLVFGSEQRGLPPDWLESTDFSIRIPQTPDERCLNLSTSCGIALYECLRQIATAPPTSTV